MKRKQIDLDEIYREKMYTFQILYNTAYKFVHRYGFLKIKTNRRFYVLERKLRKSIEQNIHKELEIYNYN